MLKLSLLSLLAVVAGIIAMMVWRAADHRADRAEWDRLLANQPADPAVYDPTMVNNLPEPARRYFNFSIKPGTPLYRVADVTMTGQFSLGTQAAPNYMPMAAEQRLAAPEGFVWKMRTEGGAMPISGSDSGLWTRFWLFGVVPVARMNTHPDHARSAFGRYVSEAVFWTPAALLPGPGIQWEAVAANTARLTISHRGFEQVVDVTVGEDGRPIDVQFPRWTNANAEKVFRRQPFGGYLSEFREFGGYRLPTHVEAGNHFGTDDYFPFFIADVSDIQFPAR